MWTEFWDMHSGGSNKVKPYECIYIEAPFDEAKIIFQNRFGRNPRRVTCTCCGPDYEIQEYDTLEHATAYHRNCRWDRNLNEYVEEGEKYIPLEKYVQHEDVLIIRSEEIQSSEKIEELREEGYVWL